MAQVVIKWKESSENCLIFYFSSEISLFSDELKINYFYKPTIRLDQSCTFIVFPKKALNKSKLWKNRSHLEKFDFHFVFHDCFWVTSIISSLKVRDKNMICIFFRHFFHNFFFVWEKKDSFSLITCIKKCT